MKVLIILAVLTLSEALPSKKPEESIRDKRSFYNGFEYALAGQYNPVYQSIQSSSQESSSYQSNSQQSTSIQAVLQPFQDPASSQYSQYPEYQPAARPYNAQQPVGVSQQVYPQGYANPVQRNVYSPQGQAYGGAQAYSPAQTYNPVRTYNPVQAYVY